MMLSSDKIMRCLPDPPEDFHYEVKQDSHMWWSVWLIHEANYDYACGKEVKTIWGFVKKDGSVYRPQNHLKPSKIKVGELLQAYKLSPYTTIVPKCTSLLHLL